MKSIINFILIGILSLPSVFGLNHFLYEEHVTCSEQNLHFHEVEIDCCTCDFIRLDIEFNSDNNNYSFNEFPTNYKYNSTYNYIVFSNYLNYFDSRGPPVDC
ncbi:hypothetical protein OAC35_00485 [Flavobacteriaceae bacterium]|nr:hypothetical protein [Flavobacteriaceae bacterium]MDB9849054.1 hypothetical protein [Flavobacteriaceae bacterium]MDB9853012.1 hypothetical protein [Flavobacteriaceae bacterium]